MKFQRSIPSSRQLLPLSPQFLLSALLFSASTAAQAAVPVYDDTTNFTGFSVANGGTTTVSGDSITRLVGDDIFCAPGSGGQKVTGFTFSVANGNTTTVSARPRIRFYQIGNGGAPGNYITGFAIGAITFPAGVSTYSFTLSGPQLWTIPANGSFWAGICFDNNSGATGATVDQLNLLGQGTFDPPTVGSSADQDFVSNGATGAMFVGNNPPGSVNTSPFGGNPVANFGWQIVTATGPVTAPAPGSLAVIALGSLPLVGALRRRRAARRR